MSTSDGVGTSLAAAFFAGRRVATFALALPIIVAFSLSSWSATFDEQLRIYRESIVTRPATGAIHIAEIDARSIRALSDWPWPRVIHARLIDRLREAGAKTIAFDVDFSASSSSAQDRALARALDRADRGVVLPTFRQSAGSGSPAFVENLPLPLFRERAVLASVNIHADRDGMMRSMSYGTRTNGLPRPALPAMLAGVPGRIDEEFLVSTAIDPAALPRHSVIDILDGRIAPGTLRGKTVLVGATALELGDRYAMPRHGVQPGVVIQALATETLLQRLALPAIGPLPAVLFALAALAVVLAVRRWRARLALGAMAVLLALPFALEALGWATIEIAGGLITGAGGMALIAILGIAFRFDTIRTFDPATGLRNERALAKMLAADPNGVLVAMRIRNYDEIVALIADEHRAALIAHIEARVTLAEPDGEIFSLGHGDFAWRPAAPDLQLVTERLEGLAALFAQRLSLGSHHVVVTPVFGIAPAWHGGEAIARAELAAARAVAQGSRWALWTADLSGSTGRSQRLLADLDEAMENGAISLVFQPKLVIRDNSVDGVEALVRWRHPELGPIPPDQFVPLLEKHGRLECLTLFIVDRCIEQARIWTESGRNLEIAINISAPLLSERSFAEGLSQRLALAGPLARRISLELTESAMVLDDGPLISALNGLRALGAKISIDDYGTGQSTLTYLKRFPADEIKIDQSFVRNVAEGGSDEILVRSTIAMAHELGLSVVAEGVENGACLARLAELGCDCAQGWHISKGVPANELEVWLDTRAGVPARRAA